MSKKKNEAAAALGRQRWKGVSKAKRSEAMSAVAAAAMTSMTPEQRTARAKKAVAAREAKKKLAQDIAKTAEK